ncbi:MAG: S-layer homology domain-containing protein, partial [Clostridia bacterium]|nr:S-layer homology domain-containing protein [Clostridia bacterium]
MKKLLISLIAVILLCSMAVGVSAEWNNPFKDVKESHWFYDAVKTTVEKGIFNGMSEDTFQPNGKMTRAMFMTTLANMVGAEVGEYTGMPFTDVKENHWYAPYVQWAYDNGISSGMSADRFGVNDPITREQMVTLFYNTAAKFGADTAITDTYKFDKTYDAEKIREY